MCIRDSQNSPRVLYMLHHEDDDIPDDYVCRPYMTVLGFGRQTRPGKTEKFLTAVQTFSIGFIESKEYSVIEQAITQIVK